MYISLKICLENNMAIKHIEIINAIRDKVGILVTEENKNRTILKRNELLTILTQLTIYENNLTNKSSQNQQFEQIIKLLSDVKNNV